MTKAEAMIKEYKANKTISPTHIVSIKHNNDWSYVPLIATFGLGFLCGKICFFRKKRV